MTSKQRAAIAAICGAVTISFALPGMAATCQDAKGKRYDCKVSNMPSKHPAVQPQPSRKPAAQPPASVLQQQASRNSSLVRPTQEVRRPQPSLINNNAPRAGGGIVAQGAGNIVAQGAGNAVSRSGSGIVAQGAGNAVNRNNASIISTNGGGLVRRNGN